MLFSQREERERHFKLALRAAIPILLLVGLVFYSAYLKGEIVSLNIENNVLIAAIVFISVYFIYFFLERSAQESLIDPTTQAFAEKTLIDKLKKKNHNTLILIVIENLSLINQNYSTAQVEMLLYNFVYKLNYFLIQEGLHEALIGRRYGAEFLVALNSKEDEINKTIAAFIEKYNIIDGIEVDYNYAIVTNTESKNFERTIQLLKNLLTSKDEERSENIKDSKELTHIEQSVIIAMKEGALSLSFRPLLNLHSNHIDTYEISAKLKHPTNEDILPRIYLPILNSMGKGRDYDLLLVKHLLGLLPLIDDSISFTFNLSPFSLRDTYFQEQFFALLDASGVDASRLIIQLYERKTHHNLGGYLRTLNVIRSHGVRICIDNFGSSNASMEYIKHFKFDMVQFDRDYVGKLDNKTNYAMLESLVQMSKDIGITTVAKWVDKEEQRSLLTKLGVDYLQGFGIAKPIDEYTLIEQYNKGKQ